MPSTDSRCMVERGKKYSLVTPYDEDRQNGIKILTQNYQNCFFFLIKDFRPIGPFNSLARSFKLVIGMSMG